MNRLDYREEKGQGVMSVFKEQNQIETDKMAERSNLGFTLDSQKDAELAQVVTSVAAQK